MPFGLKTAGITDQRSMTAIFHDMLHGCLEHYVDDIIVKSKEVVQHSDDLRKAFSRCRKYKLRMNPLKCAFGVSSRRFLGFTVHRKGVDLDSIKTKVIEGMGGPKSTKQLKKLPQEGLLHHKVHSHLGRAARTFPAPVEEGHRSNGLTSSKSPFRKSMTFSGRQGLWYHRLKGCP